MPNVLVSLKRYQEAKLLLHRQIPAARRVLGESHEATLRMRTNYARALCTNDDATLDDLHEAVTRLEDTARIARRVFGGANPITTTIESNLRDSRAKQLRAQSLQAEKLAQDAFGAARAQLVQERSELARMLADASARP